MERGIVFAHHALVEHEVLQRILRDRARDPAAAPDDRGGGDPYAGGRLPRALPRAATGWRRAPTSTSRPTSWPAWCCPTSARRDAGTSTIPSRWRCSSGPSCWPASGEQLAPGARAGAPVLPAPRPGRLGPVRALRPPHLHRLHGAGARGLAMPAVHLRGGEALAPGAGLHPHEPRPDGRGRLHQPHAHGARHHRGQRGGVLPRAVRHRHPAGRPLRHVARRGAPGEPVLPGLHRHVAPCQLPAHLLQHAGPPHRRAGGRGAPGQGPLPGPLPDWPGSGAASARTS